jgi:hypothetical protein
MRRVIFKPSLFSSPTDRAWLAKWLRRARRATAAAIASAEGGQPVEFRTAIWSDLKAFLLDRVFSGKCAYCESRVTTTDFGHADHYRPKGAVTIFVDGRTQVIEADGVPHPGYYWLAYDWRNLLPACAQCNSGDGKMNQFPIAPGRSHVLGHRQARYPAALDSLEEPRLLHPYFHNPEKHLQFGEDGTIAPAPGDATDLGSSSISAYNLRRGDLETTRKDYQELAWSEFLKAFANETPFAKALEKYRSGASPYSVACLQYVRLKFIQRQSEYLSQP